MNLRLNDKGVLVQPENDVQIRAPQIPPTLGNNPILSRSNLISIERMGRRNWSEFLKIMDQQSKQTMNYDQTMNYNRASNNSDPTGLMYQGNSSSYGVVDHRLGNGNFGNHYLSSQVQPFRNNIPSWSNNYTAPNRRFSGETAPKGIHATNMSPVMIPRTESAAASLSPLNLNMRMLGSGTVLHSNTNFQNTPAVLNSYSEVDSSWTEANFTSLLLGNEIPGLGPNNNLINAYNSTQTTSDGLHVPLVRNHNRNSPPRWDGYAISSNTNSFPYAPMTPDYRRNMFEKHRQAGMLKFLVEEGSSQKHAKMENSYLSIGNEAIENHHNELLQTIVDSSSGVLSTPLAENKSSEKGDQGTIDMNETPKQKAPKRRKHRPKVVIEGKFRRTPKVKTPTNAGLENPPTKRKYVRKQRDSEAENTTLQQKDEINMGTVPNLETREKSSRKRLRFEIGKGEMQDQGGKVQAENQQNQQGLNLNLNLNYPANQMLVEGTTNYNKTLNVIARNFSSRKDEKWEHRELNRNISRANNSLVRYREMRWKSTHQMVERDVGNFKGFCGSKSEYINHTQQAGPSSENKQAIQLENQETISTKDETLSEAAHKKQKTETRSSLQRSGAPLSYSQGDRITMNQQTDPEKMREAVACRSTQAHDTAYLTVMTNPNLQSEITSEKATRFGYQRGNEKNYANTQNNRLNMAPIASSADSKKARGQPEAKRYSKKMIGEITYRLRILNISSGSGETDRKDKYALVPYEGGGAIVMYEHRKRKPRPKVDLDPETTRIWKLLMGKEGSEASAAENTDREKWWEEERRVFQGRADSFIARMHLVQGDRRFSPWKGSIVDSVIGVFLTQNVSDHLSSSAFMALAAQFPLCSTTPDQGSDQSGTSILTEEPEIQGQAPYGNIGCLEKIMMQPLYTHMSGSYFESSRMGLAAEPNGISEENASSSQNSSDSFVLHINGEIQSSSGSNSEAEDSSHGGKPIKINGLKSVQLTNRTATIPILQTPENESACFDDYNKQIQGSHKFNNLQSFSTLTHPISSSISNMQNPSTPRSYFQLLMETDFETQGEDCFAISREDSISSFPSRAPGMMSNTVGHGAEMTIKPLSHQNELPKSHVSDTDPFALITKHLTAQKSRLEQVPWTAKATPFFNNHQEGRPFAFESEKIEFEKPSRPVETFIIRKSEIRDQVPDVTKHTGQIVGIKEATTEANKQVCLDENSAEASTKTLNPSQKHEKEKQDLFEWDNLRRMALAKGRSKERSVGSLDSMDYEAMRCADVDKISSSIKIRGMNNMLADRIKDFLNRVTRDHGSIDLEWLRDVPPDKAKDYLLSIRGLGLKSVECVRLLTLHHIAFPVDTNVGRIAVRLGWVPLQPLPESLQLHLLEMYPVLESVQKYLWPRLCKLDQRTLYELHYQLITFGKVFCTKSKPNCNACPMRGECRHFASAFASARLALPAPEEKSIVGPTLLPIATEPTAHDMAVKPMLLQPSGSNGDGQLAVSRCEPIIEEPATPEPEITEIIETDIEDAFLEDPDEIPTIKLNVEQLAVNLRNFMEEHMDLQESDMSKAIVALTPEVASIPAPKLKYVLRLRTERQVYVLTDTHPLIQGLDKREPDDPSPYLLALLAPGETSSGHPSESCSEHNGPGELCNRKNEEANPLTVRGTLLIPCRTAMRGRFPLNGTYFQVNEVFADHESSLNPIEVPRAWLWHLEMRTVYFGTSATSIFRGMTTKEIQNSFWRGFVCVRGFDRKTRAPRPLNRNLHIPQSRLVKPSDAAK